MKTKIEMRDLSREEILNLMSTSKCNLMAANIILELQEYYGSYGEPSGMVKTLNELLTFWVNEHMPENNFTDKNHISNVVFSVSRIQDFLVSNSDNYNEFVLSAYDANSKFITTNN